MSPLTYPRTAETITARARMNLAAYRAVPGREAANPLERSLHDMWHYSYFAIHNDNTSAPWTQISQKLFDALQLLKKPTPDPAARPDPASQADPAARAAADAIHRFAQATGIAPGTAPEPFYTRAEAERAAHAAFERLRLYVDLDHRHDRQFVTGAFLAFLDDPDSPYPYKSHDPDDEQDGEDGDEQAMLEPNLQETGERGHSQSH